MYAADSLDMPHNTEVDAGGEDGQMWQFEV